MSDLLLIAVPGGRHPNGDGRLSVVIVPRLDGSRTLGEEGLAVWPPSGVSSLPLSVEFPDVGASMTVVAELAPTPGLWNEFFGRIGVEPPRPPRARSMSVTRSAQQASVIQSAYSESASAMAGAPAGAEMLELALPEEQQFDPIEPIPVERAAEREAPSVAGMAAPGFNTAIGLLREHPTVLRALGLIIDLTISAAQIPAAAELLRVSWIDAPSGLPSVVSPTTSLAAVPFRPNPADETDLHPTLGGMLRLADEQRWAFTTIDLDDAVKKLRGLGSRPVGGELPALRTVGLALMRIGRGDQLNTVLRNSAASRRNDPLAAPLTAESLTLGYRVDVQTDSDDTWRSLCLRRANYRVNGVEFASDVPEEGHLKAAAGIDHGDEVLRSDEIVARWDGWSLAAPRPHLDGRPPLDVPVSPDMPYDLRIELRPEPGSLPRQRFGSPYRMRIRIADIAGGGMTVTDDSIDECDSQRVRFTRNEPVRPPQIRLPEGVEETSLELGVNRHVLVIRTAERIASSEADTLRHLDPPVAAFEVVERHGRFNGPATSTIQLFQRDRLPDPLAEGVAAFLQHERPTGGHEIETSPWRPEEIGREWPDYAPKAVRLHARRAGETTLDWNGEELHVRLAPAEQVTIDLASSLHRDAIADLSLAMWLEGLTGRDDLLIDGRHPMASPPQRLTLLHAVKRQRDAPHGTFRALRTSGTSFADLEPSVPMLGVDVSASGTLEVAASWHAVDDTADPPTERRPVERFTLSRTQVALPLIRHEFGDTKHRLVTYTLTARGRFRDCFSPDLPADDFAVIGVTGEVNVLSSARPVAPTVLAATPGFVWTETRTGARVVRRRLGNRIRIEVAAPWFTTGDGEHLAVIPSMSVVGRDPIWDGPVPASFGVVGQPIELVQVTPHTPILVVPHGVWQAAGRWFADVLLEAPNSYNPLARLAVGRFQPNSLEGLELSEVVFTDYVPVLPDRTLTVESSESSLTVRVDGLGHEGLVANRVNVIVEEPVDLGSGIIGALDDGVTWRAVAGASGTLGESLIMDRPPSAGRVRVREVEGIGAHLDGVVQGTGDEIRERIVYTDIVKLS